MRQWTKKDYCRMLERNGYHYDREGKGSHSIYTNHKGIHITVSKNINPCVGLNCDPGGYAAIIARSNKGLYGLFTKSR